MPATSLTVRAGFVRDLSHCKSGPCPRHFVLWNQKVTDTGSLLFAGKARSYGKAASYNQDRWKD